ACAVMTVPQLVVIGFLFAWGLPLHGLGVAALLLAQFVLMVRYLLNAASLRQNPRDNAAKYNGSGTTLYVIGMLVSAFALRDLLMGASI
ncbi:MAG: bacteriochlorophyll/chlorophyll a synthase, partial [Pseudomonadota bacterium]